MIRLVGYEVVDWVLVIIGEVLVAIGVFCDLMGALGMLRFPNFFVRLHAATVGTIGGAVVPILGAALIAAGCDFLGYYRWFMSGAAVVTAVLILIIAPAGSHVLARATHRSRTVPVEPKVVDMLEEESRGGE